MRYSAAFENRAVIISPTFFRFYFVDGETQDSVVYEDTLLDSRRWRMRKEARARGVAPLAARDANTGSMGSMTEEPIKVISQSVSPNLTAEAGSEFRDDDSEGVEQGGATDLNLGAESEIAVGSDSFDWWPAPEDLEGEDMDADVPLVGNGNINIALELRMLSIGVPTIVIPPEKSEQDRLKQTSGTEASASSANESPASGSADSTSEDSVSVRYFLRLSAYTDFTPEARKWNAMEVVLYREGLYGRPLPVSSIPAALSPMAGSLSTDSASTATTTISAPASAPPSSLRFNGNQAANVELPTGMIALG